MYKIDFFYQEKSFTKKFNSEEEFYSFLLFLYILSQDDETDISDLKIKLNNEILDLTKENIRSFLNDYIVEEEIPDDEIERYYSLPSRFGIWLSPSRINNNILVSFEDEKFFDGLIKASYYFNIDFREYIVSLPFEIIDNEFKFYELKDFSLQNGEEKEIMPSAVFSGSTMIFPLDM